MTDTPLTPDTGALSLSDQLEFIEDKLAALLARCRLLETLANPRGLENINSRVMEVDREDLAATFAHLAEDLDITRAEVIDAIRKAAHQRRTA